MPITVFLLLLVAMLVIAILFIQPVLSQRNYQTRTVKRATNIALYQDKMAELQSDLENGTVEQEAFDQATLELKQQLLLDTETNRDQLTANANKIHPNRLALILVAGVPVFIIVFYALLGNPDVLGKRSSHPHFSQQGSHTTTGNQQQASPFEQKVKLSIKKLEVKLKNNPGDKRLIRLLAQHYRFIRDYVNAAKYYKLAYNDNKQDAAFLADYADTLTAIHRGQLKGKPLELVQQALKINPKHVKSLHLAGTAYYQTGDFKTALTYWLRLRKVLPDNSKYATMMDNIILETKQRIAQGSGAPAATPAGTKNTSVTKNTQVKTQGASKPVVIKGIVSLAPSLQKGVTGTERVFIFARAVTGPRMPLAATVTRAKSLPFQFTLNEIGAMAGGRKLADQKQVVIIARLSKSGQPRASAGDLASKPVVVSLPLSKPLTITIDTVVK